MRYKLSQPNDDIKGEQLSLAGENDTLYWDEKPEKKTRVVSEIEGQTTMFEDKNDGNPHRNQ